jgi:hypothetical protein
MFKKLLILTMVLLPLVGFAQELTADSPAVAPSMLDEILKALLIAFVSLLSFIGSQVLPLINQWLKTIMHFRGSAVVADALTVAFAEMISDVQTAAADGQITAEEKLWLKNRAKDIAGGKLKNLSGFYKKDLMGWLDEVLEVELGKLLSRIFGSKSSSSVIR